MARHDLSYALRITHYTLRPITYITEPISSQGSKREHSPRSNWHDRLWQHQQTVFYRGAALAHHRNRSRSRLAARGRRAHAERARRRGEIAAAVGRAWLDGQGRRAGFRLADGAEAPLAVDGDDWRSIARPGEAPIRFSVLEFDGTLVIEDPAAFLARLAEGFGREKTFGCGLMLIRRA